MRRRDLEDDYLAAFLMLAVIFGAGFGFGFLLAALMRMAL